MLALATMPSAAALKTYRVDHTKAVAEKKVTADEKAKLSDDFSAVPVSANVPTPLADAVAANVAAIIGASRVRAGDVKAIAGDLMTIAGALKAKRG